jgi:regulatory protein
MPAVTNGSNAMIGAVLANQPEPGLLMTLNHPKGSTLMATITALKTQKRNPNRINVYLDGDFAFGLSRLVGAWLTVGQELSDEKIRQLKSQDETEVALQKALHFLEYRSRTQQEVSRKLMDLGYEEEVVTDVIERLKKNQLLNDDQFAQRWVENRTALKPRGHRLMAMELRQKGVDEAEIQSALSNAPDDEELAYQAMKHRFHRYAQMSYEDYQKKASAYLGRKGFSYDVISPVLRQVWDEFQDEMQSSAS